LVLIGAFAFWLVNKPLPKGEKGPQAEALADEILAAIDIEAWQAIPLVAWSFRNENHYVWDKNLHVSQVKWKDYEAVINLDTQEGEVYQNGNKLSGDEAKEALDQAYASWCNDSFWLNAPAKIRDGGTVRSLVLLDDGTEALLVQYLDGGVTPGDAYLWVTDENGLPRYYRMWVSIIPVGGLKATWENWQEYEGTMIAGQHKIGPARIDVANIRTGSSAQDFNLPADYFSKWH
jgi:hypothetical protein